MAATSDEQTAMDIVNSLKGIGTKLVCIDFDSTFLSIHTGGMWEQSAHDLYSYVRPLFLALIPLVTQANMHVAVVTFSPQVELIQQVLRHCFDTNIADRIIIRGDDSSWSVSHHDCKQFKLGQFDSIVFNRTFKLPYIISAAKQATDLYALRIRNTDTVLIDDDQHNIRHVNDHGIAGIWFEPEETDIRSLCDSIKKLHIPTQSPCKLQEITNREHQTPGKEDRDLPCVSSGVKRKTFNLCTPSPVMKMKYGHVANPRKPTKLRCSRNIQHTIETLELSIITNPSP